jgi:MFS family permease
MSSRHGGFASVVTLGLSTLLHAFTHAYGAMLVPLYLLIVRDLHLRGVESAAMIVTVYGLVYALGSYGAGVMADRVNRKAMLGVGLMLNAVAIVCMGLTRSYPALLLLAILAGLAGTLFHPSANALVPEHFPKSPGMVIGLLGIGSGLGFFAGPQYAGWRAETARWHWHAVADWQRPCVELGIAGLVMGALFLLLAREARQGREGLPREVHPPLGKTLRWRVLAIAVVLGCRDFAGVASLSLSSIYFQKAQHRDPKETGLFLGIMMLMGVVANPLAVWLSPGRRRLRFLTASLIISSFIIASVPLAPKAWVLPVLCLFQSMHLGSYAMSDAAILERVPANVRGRVVGLFLTIAGSFAGISPWLMGFWTDRMGSGTLRQLPYLAPFGTLGLMMAVAAFSTPIIAKLGQPDEAAIDPLSEIMPATMEPAG